MRAIEERKRELAQLAPEDRTQQQDRQLEYLRRRGSITLLVSAVSASLETILSMPLPNKHALRFRDNCSPVEGVIRWRRLLNSLLPFVSHLAGATDNSLQRQDRVNEAIALFQSMVESTVEANKVQYRQFANLVTIG